MAHYQFTLTPVDVPKIHTQFRTIRTAIPAPDSIPVLERLQRLESRSMHGQLPVVWDRAADFQVWDKAGNRWIDFTSTIFVTNTGHANPRVKAAIQKAVDQDLLHTYTFPSEIRVAYLEKLIAFTPPECETAYLLSSGTEATECALKLMRLYALAHEKRRGGIISFEDAMHGRTMGAQMLGGTPASRRWIGYEDPNIHRLPFPYPWTVGDGDGAEKFHQDIVGLMARGVDFKRDICGFMLESYIGWAAAFFPRDYVQALVAFARENGILVTFDDIQGGFGRTGTLFAYQHYGVQPDLICCGKGISSSLPLSAVLGRASVMNIPGAGEMSSTHSANPVACAAGLASIEAIESLDLVSEAARKGEELFGRLRALQDRFAPRISHVLGHGLLAGIIFVDPETRRPDAETASRICERAMQKGLLLVHTGRESIKLGPPLTIPDAALSEGLGVLAESIQEVTGSAR